MQHIGVEGRLYPNVEQLALMKQTIGCCRFMYNTLLEYTKTEYEKGNKINRSQRGKLITQLRNEPDKEWLKTVPSSSLHYVNIALTKAYDNFFRNPYKDSFPKFHKGSESGSFTIAANVSDLKLYPHHKIKLPKMGKVSYRGLKNLPKDHRIISATIHVTTDDVVTFSLKVECEEFVPFLPTNKIVGLDLGVKNLVTTSDGDIFPKLSKIKQLNSKKDFYQMKVSKAVKGSKNQKKWKNKYTKVSRKIANIRKGYCQYISHILTFHYEAICMEDLSIKQMLEDQKLSNINRAISDAGMGNLTMWIEWMAKKRGRKFIKIDRYYPSSQTCNSCEFVNPDVKNLSIRTWTCPKCGAVHDRDINAAKNIRDVGLTTLSGKSR